MLRRRRQSGDGTEGHPEPDAADELLISVGGTDKLLLSVGGTDNLLLTDSTP